MAAQRASKRKKLAAKPDRDTTDAIDKAKVRASMSRARAKAEEKSRLKATKVSEKAHQALVAARLVAEEEHQAQLKRVSFIVRLTVDGRGQPRWTEIEPVQTSRKQNFPGLDGERLVSFMRAYINYAVGSEPANPATFPSGKVEAPSPGLLRPIASLIVSDVRVFRPGRPDFMTVTLTPEESFVVQARFQLQGPDARSLTARESSYSMTVYAKEVTSGKSMLLTTYSAELIRDVVEYAAPTKMPGLPPGLYHLFIVVILRAPIKMAGFYETIIHVI